MLRQTRFLFTIGAVAFAGIAQAAVTNDRLHSFGDDLAEGASAGGTVGANFTNTNGDPFTADSAGVDTTNFLDFQDLQVFGTPTYVDVTSRPGATPGSLGITFDGVDDSLRTDFGLNLPTEFWDNINFFVNQDFPHNYEGILSHGIEVWAKPSASGLGQGTLQHIVRDTDDGGGIYISENDTWGLDYDDELFESNVAVDTSGDGWTHLMQLGGVADPTGGTSAAIGVLLVNGVAVAATDDVYDSAEQVLSVGSNQTGDDNFYTGQLDDLSIFLWGDNSAVADGPLGQSGQDYGALNLSEDNDWIAQELASLGVTDAGDVNVDGTVDLDDVTAFVDNWLSRQLVNDTQVGDWNSRQLGDLNYDGIVDLKDWGILNADNPAAGAAALSALRGSTVPEPSSILLLGLISLAAGVLSRRR